MLAGGARYLPGNCQMRTDYSQIIIVAMVCSVDEMTIR
jgi:hypothetical protein